MRSISEEQMTVDAGVLAVQSKGKSKSAKVKIKSRFGDIEVDKSNRILFPHGILGIPAAISFCLTEMPNIETDQFKLLQCHEDHGLSFIVVPSQFDNQLIEAKDMADACRVLGIENRSLLLLFIVTVHENGKERYLSVNAKAPLFIDVSNKTATQYVFQNATYAIQHRIS